MSKSPMRLLVAIWLVVASLASPSMDDVAMVDDCERRRAMVATICKSFPQSQCSQATTDVLVSHGCSTTSGHPQESTEQALLASMEHHQKKAEKSAHTLGLARPRCQPQKGTGFKNGNSTSSQREQFAAPVGPSGPRREGACWQEETRTGRKGADKSWSIDDGQT